MIARPITRNLRKYAVPLVAAAFILLFPLSGHSYYIYLIILSLTWSVVTLSWNLVFGYGGIWAFGQLVFLAVGGYTSGWLTLNNVATPWIGMLIGGLLAALFAGIICIPVLRLKGIYIALFTFVCEEFMAHAVVQMELTPYTGGPMGLLHIPPFGGRLVHYYLIFALFLATALTIYTLINSKIGLAIISMRESEVYSECLGVDTRKIKILLFVISGLFTGFAGSFLGHFSGAVSKGSLSSLLLVTIAVMMLIGGLGTFYGPIAGAFILTFLTEHLRIYAAYRLLAIGAIIPIVLVLMPEGIVGYCSKIRLRMQTRKPRPD